ncbi:hypothetical protein RhiirA4_457246 [Rhizophagus irregularis]|uniref:Zinc finger mym-type protein 2-like: PROVISIONAL n=1 Tax=Rhizophagus irregularis TaxID=588596 RepID=A0A2I1G9J6_9GLOM|nr:hypothetical protein RhiirA4_457246 [Rhizophagus irregularis]
MGTERIKMKTLSTSSNNFTKTNKLTTYERFVILTNKDLQAIQAYSRVANTDDRLSDIFYPNRIINIHDKHKWKRLHEIFDGRIKQIQNNQDTFCKKTDALEMCEIKTILDLPNIQTDTPKDHSIEVNIPREKNNAGGAKNPYNSGRHNYIPPDLPNNYSPMADILLYQSKKPKNCKTSEFFLRINTPREIYHGNWFSDLKLGKNFHDNMLKNIVADCKIDANGNLINHSMRSTGISLWMLLGISHAEQMDITEHRTLAGISVYSTSTAQQRKKNRKYIGKSSFIPASQLLRYDQLEIQSLEQDHKITQDSSKLPVINIKNINIQNCNNVKVEVIVKPFE